MDTLTSKTEEFLTKCGLQALYDKCYRFIMINVTNYL